MELAATVEGGTRGPLSPVKVIMAIQLPYPNSLFASTFLLTTLFDAKVCLNSSCIVRL